VKSLSLPLPVLHGERGGVRGSLHEPDSRRIPLTRIASDDAIRPLPDASRACPTCASQECATGVDPGCGGERSDCSRRCAASSGGKSGEGPQLLDNTQQNSGSEDEVSVQGHARRARDAVRDVLHHLYRPGQYRHGRERDPEGAASFQHRARLRVLRLCLSCSRSSAAGSAIASGRDRLCSGAA